MDAMPGIAILSAYFPDGETLTLQDNFLFSAMHSYWE
jgi:hypothetical protein